MSLRTLFTPRRRAVTPRRSGRAVPRLEALEGRLLLACDEVLWNQHVDVEVEYENEELALVLHDESSDQTCLPEETLLYIGPNARTTQPAGWDFIGAGAGNAYWRLTQERLDPDLLVLGGAAEEIAPGVFDAYRPADPRVLSRSEWLKVTLRELIGPGHVSVWRDGQAPQQWWISSFDGGRTFEPAFYVPAGAHVDYNWGFSAPGYYLVGLEAMAFQSGSGLPLRSALTYYQFYVDDGMGSPGGSGVDPGIVQALTPFSLTLPMTIAPAAQRPEDPARVSELFAVRAIKQQPAQTAPDPKASGRPDHLFADLYQGDKLFT